MQSHSTLAGEAKMFSKLIAYSASFAFLASVTAFAQIQNRLDYHDRALRLIREHADGICNVVSTKGETRSAEAKVGIEAQLNSLLAKLAKAGASATGNITSSQYQGVLQDQLAQVLHDNAARKFEVFKLLKGSLLDTANTDGVGSAAAGQPREPQNLKPSVPPPSALNSPCVPTPRSNITAKVARRDAGLNGPSIIPALQNPVSAKIPIDDDEWTFLWPGFMAMARATGDTNSQILVGMFTNDERGLVSPAFLGTCVEGQHFRMKLIGGARRIVGQIISVRAGYITISLQEE
jgi:hypothetical protein